MRPERLDIRHLKIDGHMAPGSLQNRFVLRLREMQARAIFDKDRVRVGLERHAKAENLHIESDLAT